ncbi:hypothetical protein MTY66_64130 (plasmid) [Mycolicibacterium sp. TY66]|nr:hypothetical protein MTY66_64130 [Mycolicibacterium sp. TY66]BCJ85002.1 hypothetical protein MTY81_63750 [Mycolicibacterium sp. TY81]
MQPGYSPTPPRKAKGGLITAAIVGAAAIALTAGGIGGLIGNHMAAAPAPAAAAAPAAPPGATAEQVHASTVDLCTRFAAGDRAMPTPQATGFDVIPSYNYISEALRENADADSTIRDAIADSLRLYRDQASKLSHEPARGAVQPAIGWTASMANTADQRVWDLCRGYGG